MTYGIIAGLIVLSGLFSGLTLGLMSLSAHELKRKSHFGERDARRVYAVRKNGNLLLVTLLIGNVAVNAVLSIFLGSIVAGVTAAFIATGLIVIFGEILPMAVFSRFALSLGARSVWLIRIFIFIFYPVAKPIAFILDSILGEELMSVHSKQELIQIVREHRLNSDSGVDEIEERIVRGALSFSEMKVYEIMTPRSAVFAIDATRRVGKKIVTEILEKNRSRIPLFEGSLDNVVGILHTQDLLQPNITGKELAKIATGKVCMVGEDDKLDDVLKQFLRYRRHFFVVKDRSGKTVGVVTFKDILEEIIREEIADESDRYASL